jgi:hypothetical protein
VSRRYTFKNIGHQEAGATVIIHLRGSSANVLLLNRVNFARYGAGLPFFSTGGFRRRTPVKLVVPADDDWYVVLDTGGFKGNPREPRADVEVQAPSGSPAAV